MIGLVAAVLPGCNFAGESGEACCSAQDNIAAGNHTQSFHYEDLESATYSHVEYARTTIFDGTPIVPSTTSGAADVVVRDAAWTNICGYAFYPYTGLVGFSRCGGISGSNRCAFFEVDLSGPYHTTLPGWGRHNACHEFGHTVGLRHRPEGDPDWHTCMEQGFGGRQVLDDHDREHLHDFSG